MRRRISTFLLVITGILLTGYLYLSTQLIGRLEIAGWERTLMYAIFAVPFFLIAWLPLHRWSQDHPKTEGYQSWLEWGAFFSMAILSFLLFFVVSRDVLLAPLWWIGKFSSPLYSPLASLCILGLSISSVGVGVFGARGRPAVTRTEVPIEGLPEEFDGFTIAQISDLHIGTTIRRGFVERVVEIVNGLDADLVVLTGDIGDGEAAEMHEDTEPLSRLRAKVGRYYITGNHEYYWGADAWVEEIRRLKFTPLLHEHRVIERGSARLVIAGVPDIWSGTSDPTLSLQGAPSGVIRILLAHQPKSAPAAEAAGFHLQLSGHTHGGQFIPWTWVVRLIQPHVAGLNRQGRMWVYVNRGTGYWGPPVRLGSPSEISLIRLRKYGKE